VVITVPPGGSIDILFRLLADQVSSAKGQTVIIESRPGAGGVIAAEAVARAAPDGNTLLSNNNGIIISSILRKVNYDPLTSFEPICYMLNSPQVIAVHSESPYRTLADLIAAAKAKPGEMNFSSAGLASTSYLGAELLKQTAKLNNPPFVVLRENYREPQATWRDLLDHVKSQGTREVSVQRYKGLGEMNATQLWETTMDAEKRTLLKVSCEDLVASDEIFTTLMGEDVESRRKFIEENALDVRNLDV